MADRTGHFDLSAMFIMNHLLIPLITSALAMCSAGVILVSASATESNSELINAKSRIITLGSAITEIVYAIGFGDDLSGMMIPMSNPQR